MLKLFTDSSSLDLYNTGLPFFAENTPLTDAEDLLIIEVPNEVKLQIQYEKDGLQVYQVYPEQVISIQ